MVFPPYGRPSRLRQSTGRQIARTRGREESVASRKYNIFGHHLSRAVPNICEAVNTYVPVSARVEGGNLFSRDLAAWSQVLY